MSAANRQASAATPVPRAGLKDGPTDCSQQDRLRQPEEDEESQHVGRRRDEDGRRGGRIEPEPIEYQRRYRAEKARDDEVGHHRDADDGAEQDAELREREGDRDRLAYALRLAARG